MCPPIAGGSRRNREWVAPAVEWEPAVPEERRWLLCDAMTSGGLLIAAAEGNVALGTRIGRLVEKRGELLRDQVRGLPAPRGSVRSGCAVRPARGRHQQSAAKLTANLTAITR